MISVSIGSKRTRGAYVMNETQPHSTSVKVASTPISPAETSNYCRDTKPNNEYQVEVPLMLPSDNCILCQVRHVRVSCATTRLDDHPTNVRPYETVVSAVRIEVGVGVTMVSAMATTPPFNTPLNGTSTEDCETVFEWFGRVVRPM